jgi:hypothetical protein
MLDAMEEFRNLFAMTSSVQLNLLEYIEGHEAENLFKAINVLYLRKGTKSNIYGLLQTLATEFQNGRFHGVADGIDGILNKLSTIYSPELLQFTK